MKVRLPPPRCGVAMTINFLMKILIVSGIYPPEIGGSATYAALLRRELYSRGFEVSVLTYGAPRGAGIFTASYSFPKGVRHLIFLYKLLILGWKSDLIFATDSSFGAATITAIAARLLRKKMVMRVTGDYAWEQGVLRFGVKDIMDEFRKKKYGFFVMTLRYFQKFAVKTATLIIAPSEYLKRIAVGWGINPEKVKVIYNAVDLPPIRTNASLREATSNGTYNIISAGRLVPWKGFDVLMEAVAELRKDIPEIKLEIVGSGPEEKNQKSKIKNQKLESTVFLIGSLPKDKLVEQIRAADVFVLNTAYEGFSHQIVEVMSLGVPVVTTSVGGNPEIIKDGENGLLVGYNDKEAIKKAIMRLHEDRELARSLGEGARVRAQLFSVERMIQDVENAIKSL